MDRLYEAAYFFHSSPLDFLQVDLPTAVEIIKQVDRIAEIVNKANNGTN